MTIKYKHLRLNIISLFFIAVSLLSITLAWFAYSGVARTSTEVGVKAWYIEFSKNNEAISNEIVLLLDDVYPGMEQVVETVNISNLGDTDASVSYTIDSARILNEELKNENVSTKEIEDKLSHDYPFHINIALKKEFVTAKDDYSQFEVSVSWPLDSENDNLDSEWGSKSFVFLQEEEKKKEQDPNYEVRAPIKIVISLKAEQYVLSNDSLDTNYNYGKMILYDIKNNKVCSEISSTCLKTYVIDKANKVGDINVNLLPDLFSNYALGNYTNYNSLLNEITSSWNVSTRSLKIEDILSIISNDVESSYLVRDNLSDVIIGKLDFEDRFTQELNKMIDSNGYYKFSNLAFPYFSTSKCYWIDNDYNQNKAFALVKIDENNSKIYGELKTNECNVVPVLEVSKANLE